MKKAKKRNTGRTVRKRQVSVRTSRKNKKAKPTMLTKKEQKEFMKKLLARREVLLADFSRLRDEALGKSRQEASGDLSNIPIHLADQGSDNYEQDFALSLMESDEQELRNINSALEKIANGTYGLCEGCSKPIPRERLEALPSARLCIVCKKLEEEQNY